MREALGIALAVLGLTLIGGVLLLQWLGRRKRRAANIGPVVPKANAGRDPVEDTQTRPMVNPGGAGSDETKTRQMQGPKREPSEDTQTRPMQAGEGPLHVPSAAPGPPSQPAANDPNAAGLGLLAPIPTWELPTLADEEDGHDITMVTLRSHLERETRGLPPVAAGGDDDDDDDVAAATLAHPILFDEEAAGDEATGPVDIFLISAACSTDPGRVRKRNEDSFLALDDAAVYVVADGMGGYAGGDVASRLAVETLEKAFATGVFGEPKWPGLPRRAMELASSVELANAAVFAKSREEHRLRGMGTTLVAARFSPKKERLYIGHVGDSRCYRFRSGKLAAMTEDHTLASVGVGGPAGGRLVRAIGIQKHVEIDLVIAKPQPGDTYLICSDGLTKMASEEEITATVAKEKDLARAAEELVELAIAHGGKDNVTVVLVRLERALGR
jgi:serine/threonine protein phosphatase PrpC